MTSPTAPSARTCRTLRPAARRAGLSTRVAQLLRRAVPMAVVVTIAMGVGASTARATYLATFFTPGDAVVFVPQAGTAATIRDESGTVLWSLSASLQTGEVHALTGLAPGYHRITSSDKIVLLVGDMVSGSGAVSRGAYARDVDGQAIGHDLYAYLRPSDDADSPTLIVFSHSDANSVTIWRRGEFQWEQQWQGSLNRGEHTTFQASTLGAAALRITSTAWTSALVTGMTYWDDPSSYCVPSSSSRTFYGQDFTTFAPGGELYLYSFAPDTQVELRDATSGGVRGTWTLDRGEVGEYQVPWNDSFFYDVQATQPIVVCRMYQHLGGGGMLYVPAKSGTMVGTEFVVDAVDPVEVVAFQDGTVVEYHHGGSTDSWTLAAGGHQALPAGTSGMITAVKAVSVASIANVGSMFVPIPVTELDTAPGPPAVFAVRQDPPLPTVHDTTLTVRWATDEPCTGCVAYRRNGSAWLTGSCASGFDTKHFGTFDIGPFQGGDLVEYYVWGTDRDNNTVVEDRAGAFYAFTMIGSLPDLRVSRLSALPPATAEGAYTVTLRLENLGIANATCVEVRERLTGMVSPTDAATQEPLPGHEIDLRLRTPDVPAGETVYVSYELVPLLYGSFSTYGVGLGATSTFTFLAPSGPSIGGGFSEPAAFDSSAALAWIGARDYVVATDVGSLLAINGRAPTGAVLGEAARFAQARGAVVADLETDDRAAVEQLVDSDWNGRLGPQGYFDGWHYLLLLGSPAVVPSWQVEHDCVAIDPRVASTADNLYADIVEGDHFKPELILGRLPGRTAAQLVDQLQRSLTPVATDRAVLMSGPGDGDSDFVSAIDNLDEHWLAHYSTAVVRHWRDLADPVARLNAFLQDDSNTDLFLYRGHGNVTSWDNTVDTAAVATADFGAKNPMVWSIACLTGNLSGSQSLAEAFLDRGASLFIGATEVSPRSPNDDFAANLGMLHSTTAYYPNMGVVFKAAKRRLITDNIHWYTTCIGDAENKVVVNEYNLYGDPKRGEPPFAGGRFLASLAPLRGAVHDPPPSSISIAVPAFTVWTDADGLDHVRFPGDDGGTFEEDGQPIVPTWIHRVPFAPGWKVQGVTMQSRQALEEVEGLQLPVASFEQDGPSPVAAAAPGRAVFPPRDVEYAWRVDELADGSHELVLTVFPFSHDPATSTSWCFHDYVFRVGAIESSVAITAFTVDQPEVADGTPVQGTVAIFNTAATAVEALLEIDALDGAQIAVEATMDPIPMVLPPGASTVPFAWLLEVPSPADRALRARLTGVEGMLDEAWRRVRVGTTGATGFSLEVSPDPGAGFDPGDPVTALATFVNTGLHDAAGQVRFQVVDLGTGEPAHASVFDRVIPAIGAVAVQMLWDTSSVGPGVYRLTAVFEHDGRATPAMSVDLATRGHLTVEVATDRPVYDLGDKIVVWVTTTGPTGLPFDVSPVARLARPDGTLVPLELTTVPGEGLCHGSHYLSAGSPVGPWAVVVDVAAPGCFPVSEVALLSVGGSPPNPAFTWAPGSPFVGETVRFSDVSGGAPSSWAWDLGDGSTSALQNPTHVYSAPGWQEVTLMVGNAFGTTWTSDQLLVREAPLFADGFESGGCDQWSATVP